MFARYAFVGSIVGAIGTLAAGRWIGSARPLGRQHVVQGLFVLYGALGLVSFVLYRRLSPLVRQTRASAPSALGPSRRRVYGLAALFSLDAFGGGLVLNSLLALWLFERFGLDVATTGAIFFATGLCSAVSYFAAVPLARRFGLVNTMVFTHLPSSVFLILVAVRAQPLARLVCCWFSAACCRRWTCRPGPPTSWQSFSRKNGLRRRA